MKFLSVFALFRQHLGNVFVLFLSKSESLLNKSAGTEKKSILEEGKRVESRQWCFLYVHI